MLKITDPECYEDAYDEETDTCLGYKNNGTWAVISINRDFNHRDWFNPKRYISDVVDTRQLDEFYKRFEAGFYIERQ